MQDWEIDSRSAAVRQQIDEAHQTLKFIKALTDVQADRAAGKMSPRLFEFTERQVQQIDRVMGLFNQDPKIEQAARQHGLSPLEALFACIGRPGGVGTPKEALECFTAWTVRQEEDRPEPEVVSPPAPQVPEGKRKR